MWLEQHPVVTPELPTPLPSPLLHQVSTIFVTSMACVDLVPPLRPLPASHLILWTPYIPSCVYVRPCTFPCLCV